MKRINRHLLLLALPLILGFLLFYLLPFVGSLRYSVITSAFDHSFAGFTNYVDTLNNSYFRLSVKNTLELVLQGVPTLIVLSLVLALFVQSSIKKMPIIMQAALIIPMLVPSAAVANVFSKMPLDNPRIPLLAIYLWKNTGFMMLIYLSAFSMIPNEVYEAAALDGAGKARSFFSITLPSITGPLFFSAILAMAYNLRLFREAYLLYGAYPETSVYLVQHYINNHFYKLNYQGLTSASMLFALGLFMVLGVSIKFITRTVKER